MSTMNVLKTPRGQDYNHKGKTYDNKEEAETQAALLNLIDAEKMVGIHYFVEKDRGVETYTIYGRNFNRWESCRCHYDTFD